MKILVTGAAGFIGFHAAQDLLRRAHSVVGVDNLNAYYDPSLKRARLAVLKKFPRFKFIKGDIARKDTFKKLRNAGRFDKVIHLAAQAGVRYSLQNPDVYVRSNIVGFLNVLEYCRYERVPHLIYASSSSVYGDNAKVPFSVADRVETPVSLYAATKLADELMARTYAHLFRFKVTGLRFFTVYGPWGRPDMAYFSFAKNILEGKPITLFNRGEMERDFTYIDDALSGIRGAFKTRRLEAVYNVGNSRPETLLQFVRLLEKHSGKMARIRYAPMQAGDVLRTYADIRISSREIGFVPRTPLDQGLKRFMDWYRDYFRRKTM